MFLLSNILELHVWPFTSQTEIFYNTDVSCFMKSEFLFISLVQEYTCTKKRQEKLILFKGFLSLSVVKLELHIFINISSLFTWLAFWFSRIRSKNGTVVFCKHSICCWFLLLSFVHSLYVCFLRLLKNKKHSTQQPSSGTLWLIDKVSSAAGIYRLVVREGNLDPINYHRYIVVKS